MTTETILTADAELPLDIRGALTSLWHAAIIAEAQAQQVAEAASRLLAAIDAEEIWRGDNLE